MTLRTTGATSDGASGPGRGGSDPAGACGRDLIHCAVAIWAERGRRTELPAIGVSMWPAIRTGDRVIVRHGGAEPEVGEVVVVLLEGRPLAHRVIERRRSHGGFEVRTKGDLTLAADPGWFGPDRTVGVVEQVVRGGTTIRHPPIHGRMARLMARLSRWQGVFSAPVLKWRILGGVRRWAAGRR